MPDVEHHVVSAILWADDGRALLQQRDEKPGLPYAGYWTLFGGQVEADEGPDSAIRRELVEELALHDQPLTFLERYTCPVRTRGVVVTTNHVYTGRLSRPMTSLVLFEGKAMALFTREESEQVELAFAQSPVLGRWFDWFETAHKIANEGQQ